MPTTTPPGRVTADPRGSAGHGSADARTVDQVPAGEPARATSWAPRPVRLALLLDDMGIAAWAADSLREAIDRGWATVAVLVVNAGGDERSEPPAGGRRSLAERLRTYWRNRDVLPYAAYQRFDEGRYRTSDDPLLGVDVATVAGDAPVVRVRPRETKFCDYFDDAAVDEVLSYQPDVALRFGFRILKGRALEVAPQGIWSFHHGDNRVNRGGPAGFWEVIQRRPETGAILQRLTEELDAGVVLARSRSSTVTTSVTANRANYYWQAARLLVDAIRRLSTGGPAAVAAAAEPRQWTAYSERLYVAPRAGEMTRGAARLAVHLVRRKLDKVRYGYQWFLAYRFAPAANRGSAEAARPDGGVPDGAPFRFTEVLPPPDRYWADPFPAEHEGRHYIFFEEHPFVSATAHICVAEVDPKTGMGTPRVALRRDYHLSYPSVFRWEGTWYMTPETMSRQAVELYRCTRFPDAWEYVGDLLTGLDAVDPTIAEIGGRWWMFVGVMLPNASEASALHLYHAPTPLGPWTPHTENPVAVDARGTRPAGRVFDFAGAYYRPVQDGVPMYGSATVVHRIDEITPTTFRETPVSRLDPSWRPGLVGTHTLNAAGRLTVIDALRRVPRRRLRARG